MNPSHRGEGCNNFLHAREEGEARTRAVWRLGPLAVGSWDLSLAWPTEPTISRHTCSNHFVQFSILSIVGELWSCSVNFCSIVSGWVNFLLKLFDRSKMLLLNRNLFNKTFVQFILVSFTTVQVGFVQWTGIQILHQFYTNYFLGKVMGHVSNWLKIGVKHV